MMQRETEPLKGRVFVEKERIIKEFHQGGSIDAWKLFGAHFSFEGTAGVRFTVYAPHARSVSVIGSFNDWNQEQARMERIGFGGIWSLFVPQAKQGDSYQYRIEDALGKRFDKSDPFAFYSEIRPKTASRVFDLCAIRWSDQEWMNSRTVSFDRPVSVYEVYAGGWKTEEGELCSWKSLEETLIPYVKKLGFTHIEFMPLTEYPYDGSWGYQASGYYCCTSRFGTPAEFAHFVNACHREGIGVIIDMVPVHFVKDDFGLAQFDGQPLYEYPRPMDAESQWDTLNFNLWKEEVRSFLISAAVFWCRTYHIDGIRMDAISNVIFWGGEKSRGRNEGALQFIRELNYLLKREFPDVMLIAEDSSDFPKVTSAIENGGLGFDYKWDMGWMNDTLKYFAKDPLYRYYEHGTLTFSMSYFFSERFVLPLSHDENVHGKKTIIDRMWGSYEQKFAQVKSLYAYMFAHPGKKLNFMGNELASFREFDERKELDWLLLSYPLHRSFQTFFCDLNAIYRSHPVLYEKDYDRFRFRWMDADNAEQSVFSFCREGEREVLLCVMNLTGAVYEAFDVPVCEKGPWTEILNTESERYSGCGFGNEQPLRAKKNRKGSASGQHITIRLPGLSAIWFTCSKKPRSPRAEKSGRER